METQVLIDINRKLRQERNQILIGRKRKAQYQIEFLEAKESVKRQKTETTNIKTDLIQTKDELHYLKELLQKEEGHNKTLKALVEEKESKIRELKEKLAESEEKEKQNNQEVTRLRDDFTKYSKKQEQMQLRIIALEGEKVKIIAENKKPIIQQEIELRKTFRVRASLYFG